MTEVYKESRTVRRGSDEVVTDRNPMTFVARIVYLIASVIEVLLGLRFILMLLGANRGNPFTDFIYTLTRPLVAPFFGIFNYRVQYGMSRFEVETLVAMIVYGLAAWIIVRLLTLGTDNPTDI